MIRTILSFIAGALLSCGSFAQGGAIGSILWQFTLEGGILAAPAIGLDGTIYVGSDGGRMHALAPSGAEVWSFKTQKQIRVAPLVGLDGTVYLSSLDGNLYALGTDGSLKWRFVTTYDNTSFQPALARDGTIYASFNRRFFAFKISGQKLWETEEFFGVPVIGADGTLFVTGGNLIAINSNRKKYWDFTLPWPYGFITTPAIGSDGTLYAIAAGAVPMLLAIGSDGTKQWEFETDGQVSGPVLGVDGTIYLGTKSGWVYAVQSDGRLLWKKIFEGLSGVSPAVVENGLLLVGATSGRILGTTLAGDQIWSATLDGQLTAPAVGSDGTLYVGSSNAKLYAIKANSRPATAAWSLSQSDGQRSGRAPYAPSLPGVPRNVSASRGTYPGRVVVTWQSSANALEYEIWKSASEDVASAILSRTVNAKTTFFDEIGSENTSQFYYWVKARNAVGASEFSPRVQGFAPAGGAEGSWRFGVTGPIRLSSPALAPNGSVYVQVSASRDPVSGTMRKCGVVAIDKNGRQLWSAATGDYGDSSPAVARDGTIYVGTGFKSWTSSGTQGVMGYLYAFHADGSSKWRFPTPGQVMSSPAIGADGTVYVGCSDYRIYALSPEGVKKWEFAAGWPISSALAIAGDGTIYAGSGDNHLYAMDPAGTMKWSFLARGAVGPPVVGPEGTIYFGAGSDGFHGSPGDKRLYAVNPDGSLQWSFEAGGPLGAAPSIGGDGTIYFGLSDQRLYAVGFNGELKWSFRTGGAVSSTPAILADGTVCFGSDDGRFYRLTPDGTLQSQLLIDAPISSSPAVDAGGRIYFGGEDGNLYAIAGSSGLAPARWPMLGKDPSHPFLESTAPVPTPPTNVLASNASITEKVILSWDASSQPVTYEVWRATVDRPEEASKIAQFLRTSSYEDTTAAAGTIFHYWIKARNSNGASSFSGRATGSRPLPPVGGLIWTYPAGQPIHAAPAIGGDGTVFVGTTQTRSEPLAQHYLSSFGANGTLKWRAPVGGWLQSSAAIGGDGTVYVGSTDYHVYAFTPTGDVKWKFRGITPFGAFLFSPAIGADGTVYIGGNDNRLYAINPDGTLKWVFVTGSDFTFAPVDSSPAVSADGTIYIASARQLYAFRANGEIQWVYQAGAYFESSPVIGADGTIYIGNVDQNLHAVRTDGTRKWLFAAGGAPAGSSPVIGSDGTIYYGSLGGNLFAIAAGGDLKWKFSTDGSITTAASVAADGTVYFGSTDDHFYAVNASGELRWKVATGGDVVSPPAVGENGTVYFGSDDGYFYFVRGDSPPLLSAWPTFHQNSRHTGLSPVPPQKPAKPASVSASKGTVQGAVRIDWNSGDWAVIYEIWRNTVEDLATATPLSTNVTASTTFDDKSAAFEQHYYYWVRSMNSAGVSDWSVADFGYQTFKKWGFDAGSAIRTSPAIDPQGRIYFGSVGAFDPVSNLYTAHLFAISRDGSLVWSFAMRNQLQSSPVIAADGTTYIASSDGNLYAISPSGNMRWAFATARPILSSPAIGGSGTVYLTSLDAKVYALKPGGQKAWEFRSGNSISASPVIGRGEIIYVGSTDRMFYALNSNGTLKWKFTQSGGPIRSSAAIGSDGTIYAGCDDRRLYAFGPDGAVKWSFQTGAQITGSPVIGADNTIFVGSADSKLYALRSDGSKRWETLLDNPTYSAPALASDGTIYVSTARGTLFSIAADGLVQAQFDGGVGSSSPVIDLDGTVYIGSIDHRLYALAGRFPLAASPWPMFQQNPLHFGRAPLLQLLQPGIEVNGAFHFTIDSLAMRNGTVESSSDLLTWAAVTNLVGNGGQIQVIDFAAAGSQHRFYRMRIP